MKSGAALEKVFVGEHYAIQLRRARAVRWSSASSPSYNVLFLLEGSLSLRAGQGESETHAPTAILAAPGEP
jgi:hypothetical protein